MCLGVHILANLLLNDKKIEYYEKHYCNKVA